MTDVIIIGNNCPYCVRLENLCREVVAENQLVVSIKKITDLSEFEKYGVMLTPGLVINGKLVLQGKLPVKSTLAHWLKNPQSNIK